MSEALPLFVYTGVLSDGRRIALPSEFKPHAALGFRGRVDRQRGLKVYKEFLPDFLPITVDVKIGIYDTGLIVEEPHGVAPVQAAGLVDGAVLYFRARDDYWSVEIGDWDKPGWYFEQDYGSFRAGVMKSDEACGSIRRAVEKYRAGSPSMEKPKPVRPPQVKNS